MESHQMPCFYKQCLGIDCPGCGMQRAFVELLKGNLWMSLKLYPALLPMIIMIFYLFLHLGFKFKRGAMILKWMFIANLGIVIISYTIKLITHI